MLTVGSFLLTVELRCLQLCLKALLLTIEVFLAIGAFLLKVELFAQSGKCV